MDSDDDAFEGDGAIRILLVDDSSDDRMLIGRELSEEFEELEVVEVGSVTELEATLKGPPFDVVISDYHLGWSDGLEVARRVRAAWPDIGAVMFTGTGTEEVAVRAMKDGLDDYVVKSVEHIKRLPMAVRRARDRRRRMRALDHAEAQVRVLLDRLPAGIYRTTREGVFVYGNPALAEILGFSGDPAALSGTNVIDLYLDPERRAEWVRLLEEEGVTTQELQMKRPDGRVIWVRDRVRVVRSPAGRIRFFEGVLEDVTERHRAEVELARQVRSMKLLQAVTAVANEVSELSPALEAALGRICSEVGWPVGHAYEAADTGEGLRSSGVWVCTAPLDLGGFRDLSARATFTPGEGMVGRVHATGRPEWIEDLQAEGGFLRSVSAIEHGLRAAAAVPIVAGEEMVAVLEFFHTEPQPRDDEMLEVLVQAGVQLGRVVERERAETERDKIRSKARQAQKMEAVGRLAGGVAHDFNNLLTVLLMEAREVREVEGVPAPVREGLNTILDTAERAALLTRQLLTFSKDRPSAPTVFPLSGVVRELRTILERILGEAYRLRTILPEEDTLVRIDRVELEQVLVNLVVNARDAMPEGGRITIEVERRVLDEGAGRDAGVWAILSVSDEGEGIPEEIRDRIFEPFFTTKEEGGTGLGLSICYGIVNEVGGELRVYSEEGRGTTFRVMLPAVDGPQETPEAERGDVPRGTEVLLVVEDNPAVRRVTVRVLEGQGYTVIEAEDGERALEIVGADLGPPPVALVVSDVVLPGMDGPELIDRIRALYPGMPALLMSGYSAVLVTGTSEIVGPTVGLIQKPFSLATLAREVRSLLDRHASGEGGTEREPT